MSHVVWLLALCLLLVGRAKQWGARGGFERTAALWPLLFPTVVRFDFLRHTDCDLAPTLLGLLAFVLLERRRPAWAGAVLGLSTAAKLLPGLLLVPLLLGSWRRALPAFGLALATAFALPMVFDRPGFVSNVLAFSLVRDADTTALAAYLPEAWQPVLLLAGASSIAGATIALVHAGHTRDAQLRYAVGAHLALLLTGKVFHNNYLVWVLPWVGLWFTQRLVAARAAQTNNAASPSR